MTSGHTSYQPEPVPEGGTDTEPCPYCKGRFPRNLPLVNGETQLQRHIKVFHSQFAEKKNV